MECKHKYIGSSDGVTCAFCGAHWTHEQYVSIFAEKSEAKKETAEPKKRKPRKT